ncbi:MAG: hypothetical protein A3C84_00200 [Candidatus Ryanbacteria bacterium RIFCSPHIGHO2_02_FULL_48_12]|uniref:TVP38/TMEM64 family membrane protein n=1 Tax=Candidatus Ryanbacteria bacterium RIFCSPHIGHO2_01_FULL_48_27 TaxID=1802115 RepID=A0A1G2G5B5_9BACT|nr:MAG: hypothetical protein A2756_00240 [Candidatus Ryanbacteria bacterium RIFCSPHIGHO2_01_FULL_48_27]OGZ50397.1 MAG: hypothetical protein A3C84_00200 [Candidatus Ryanbacteria bacterium RIFCSPHIGHO2_02_FULL_48_12]
MLFYTLFFLCIFAFNLIPFLVPGTWTVVAFVSMRFGVPVILLAAIAAVAATLGRLSLAKLSRILIRQNILRETTKKNLDHIKGYLEVRKELTFGIFLLYAFSPFPSNQLFIAYGLTALPLRLIALPFLFGRLVSYTFWAYSAQVAHQAFLHLTAGSILNIYFLGVQIGTLGVVYLFTKINWKKFLEEGKIALLEDTSRA